MENGSWPKWCNGVCGETMYLNLYKNHFSYIKNLDHYCQSYACRKCGKLWKHTGKLHRHESTCDKTVKHNYVGGAYSLPQTIFEKLEEEDIIVAEADRYYPYRATYDFECYMKKEDLPTNSDKVTWEAKHVPLSVSVCSNVPGYQDPVCYVTEGDSQELVNKMLARLKVIADEAYTLLRKKFEAVFLQLDRKIAEAMKNDENDEDGQPAKKLPLERLKEELDAYLKELNIIGFNSGKYDLNVIKCFLITGLQQKKQWEDEEEFMDVDGEMPKKDAISFTVKKNNNIMCLKTEQFKFVDILNYLAPGFSYDKFLKAFGCSLQKGFLPYEWIDDLQKLEYPELPPHSAFYSQLKKENISEEDYAYCQKVWTDEGMQNFRDFLVHYNNRDVLPFLEALEKQAAFYAERHIDMFKDGISVPGLTMKYLFQGLPHDTYFTLYNNEELHKLVKDNIVGGPSLIFHRYSEAGKTKVREADYKEEAKMCERALGLDANALYLYCLMQDMPTGWYVRRQKENNFKPETSHHYSRQAVQWLEWIMKTEGIEIRHEFNGKEKRLGRRQLAVDGWCKEKQRVYQFHGCYWHGHRCALNLDAGGHPKVFNETKGRDMSELREETRKNTAYLRKLGYDVVELWECEWKKMQATDADLQEFLTTRFQRPLENKRTMSEEEVKSAVLSGELFGLIECDVSVPEELKDHFAELQPIFKNVDMSREDIGETM